MQYREDKRSGNMLSALGYGCMRFPTVRGKVDIEKTERLILDAFEDGVNYYDTAYLYSGSEEALGRIVEKHGLREKIYIATKLPQSLCKSREDFDSFFDTQQHRLRTDYFNYYLMHNFAGFHQWERLCSMGIEDWIRQKKECGEIKQIGFSYHGSSTDFPKLLEAYDWDFVQIQYNYINTNYQAGTEGLKFAAAKGISVFIMEPLLGGKLATGLPKQAESIFKLAEPDASPASWALRWVWDQPEVTLLLSGMNEPEQLTENLQIADKAVPEVLSDGQKEVISQVVEVFNKSYKIPCTGCNYCMPCPKGISIPACFAAYNTSYAVSWSSGIHQYITSTGAGSSHPHYVSDCIQCGKCQSHCPQGIQIPKALKAVKHRLQIPGMKAIAPKVMQNMAK